MKKTARLAVALLICLATLLSVASCSFNFNIETEGHTEVTADTMADSFTLLEEFFAETLKNENYVVTGTGNDEVIYVENLIGDKSFLDYKTTETKMYCFVDGEKYVVATESEESRSYTTDKETYDGNHPYFMGSVKILKFLTEASGTFSCTVVTDEKNSETTASLTFEIKMNGGTIKITATAKNGLLQTAAFNSTQEGTTRTTELAFAYGNASVTLPDITEWANMDGWDSEGDEEGEEGSEGDTELQ